MNDKPTNRAAEVDVDGTACTVRTVVTVVTDQPADDELADHDVGLADQFGDRRRPDAP